MERPKIFLNLPKWLHKYFNAVLDYAESIRPLPSETCEVYQTPRGTQILPLGGGGAGQGATARHPFQATVRNRTESSVDVSIYYGTINGTAAKISGAWSHLPISSPPTLTLDDGKAVYAKATITATYVVTALELVVDDYDAPADTIDEEGAGDFYVRICTAIESDGAISVIQDTTKNLRAVTTAYVVAFAGI